MILHYNGQQWNEMQFQRTEELYAIWGISSDYLIAAGKHGALLQYNGFSWKRLNADKRFYFSDITGNSDKIYMLAYIAGSETQDNIGKEFFLEWADTNFAVTDSMTTINDWNNPKFGDSDILLVDDKLFSVGSGVFVNENSNKWEKLLDTFPNHLFSIFGLNKNHIFTCGGGNSLYFFNGSDWKKLDIPGNPLLPLYDVWCNDDEVFVIGEDGNKSYVIHGK